MIYKIYINIKVKKMIMYDNLLLEDSVKDFYFINLTIYSLINIKILNIIK